MITAIVVTVTVVRSHLLLRTTSRSAVELGVLYLGGAIRSDRVRRDFSQLVVPDVKVAPRCVRGGSRRSLRSLLALAVLEKPHGRVMSRNETNM